MSRWIAVARSSSSGGCTSRSRACDAEATDSNHGRPAASQGAAGPVAAAMNRSIAGAPIVHPGHDATTTSPLSNSRVNWS